MGIGKNLKRIAKLKGYSLKEIAQHTGISINTLYSITKKDDVKVNEKYLTQIADFLGVTTEALTESEQVPEYFDRISEIMERLYVKQENISDLDYFDLTFGIESMIEATMKELNPLGLLNLAIHAMKLSQQDEFTRIPENSTKKELPPAANRKQPEDE